MYRVSGGLCNKVYVQDTKERNDEGSQSRWAPKASISLYLSSLKMLAASDTDVVEGIVVEPHGG